MKRWTLITVLVLMTACGLPGVLLAADYPSKPVKMVINFSAGGTTDVAARLMAKKVEEVLGQTLVCTNEAGAGGTLGVSTVSRAKPDGYTIGTANMPSLAIIPQIREVPYDPEKSFTHIAAVMPYEYAVMVRSDAPWQSWEEFVAYVKANPGKVSYGSVGTGTTNHLTMARIGKELGLQWNHVPFQGGVKETAALLGGHVDCINNTVASVVSSVQAGKIRLLMITSQWRWPLSQDVPTMAEKGFGFSQVSYMSVLGPAGLSKEIRAKLEQAFKEATNDPKVLAETHKINLHPKFISGPEYADLLQQLSAEWGPLLEELGVEKKK